MKSKSLLTFSINSRNPVQKSSHIIESFAWILKKFVLIILLPTMSLGVYLIPKLSLDYYIYIKSYPMSSYWFALIKIYYVCSILYPCCTCWHNRQILSSIKTINFGLFLIMSLYFKMFFPLFASRCPNKLALNVFNNI